MNAQVIGTVFVTATVCAVIAYIALMRQAANHSDDRAVLLRGQLDAFRAGQDSILAQLPEDGQWQEPDPEWWDRQFDGITSGLGDDEGSEQP
jgi:hypothetical protein